MHTSIADERILLVKSTLSLSEAQTIADKKKTDAFGTVNKVASFLSRPKDDDFELIYSEHRCVPFWFVACEAKYVYDRKTNYHWPVSGTEVQEVTLMNRKYVVNQGEIEISGVDHCIEEEQIQVFVDGLTSEKNPKLNQYQEYAHQVTDKAKIEQLTEESIIFVPPSARASAIVREVLNTAAKVIQADEIFEENIAVSAVDLYYHPVYAFQFRWLSKQKEAIVEIDGVTGAVTFGKNIFKQYLGKALDREFLLDLGTDAVDLFVPGGGIAVKVAKKVMQSTKKS